MILNADLLISPSSLLLSVCVCVRLCVCVCVCGCVTACVVTLAHSVDTETEHLQVFSQEVRDDEAEIVTHPPNIHSFFFQHFLS